VPADNATWISLATVVFLIAVLALAVRSDLASHRIPNWLTFGAFGAGLVLAAVGNETRGLLGALAGAAVAFACLMPLHLARGMGAGDVKLMAAAGAFLGPYNAFFAAMLTLAAGAVFGLALLAWRAIALRTSSGAMASDPPLGGIGKERFPYAAAIAAGVLGAMWMRGLLNPLTGSLS
jgi:prepilin peptidase CpaA